MVEHWPSKPAMRVRSPSSALEEDAPVAQWTEQRPSKPLAGGSNPPGRRWRYVKWGVWRRWLARWVVDPEVAGSSPVTPPTKSKATEGIGFHCRQARVS